MTLYSNILRNIVLKITRYIYPFIVHILSARRRVVNFRFVVTKCRPGLPGFIAFNYSKWISISSGFQKKILAIFLLQTLVGFVELDYLELWTSVFIFNRLLSSIYFGIGFILDILII